MLSLLVATTLGLTAANVNAAPASEKFKRQSTTTLTQAEIDVFSPYTYFASAGYCPPETTFPWSCGRACLSVPKY